MKTYYLISDLHLGEGNFLEDFLLMNGEMKKLSESQRKGAIERQHEVFSLFIQSLSRLLA